MILHYDLDAFFASVEQTLNPNWVNLPLLVAGAGNRSVVSAASYQARIKGAKSAMNLNHALQLCPNAVVVTPRFPAYKKVSEKIRIIASEYTNIIEPISLDEAYLELGDITCDEAVKIGREIKNKVQKNLNLKISIGISDSKLLAKLASGEAKPNGLRLIRPEHGLKYLETIDLNKIWGIGPVTETKLSQAGIKTVTDLQNTPQDLLVQIFGKALAEHLKSIAFNKDQRKVNPPVENKSLSHETTFEKDQSQTEFIEKELTQLVDSLVNKINKTQTGIKTVSVKVKYWDFQERSKSISIAQPTSNKKLILELAQKMLKQINTTNGIRLLGVRLSGLSSSIQNDLFEETNPDLQEEKPLNIEQVAHWGMEVEHPVFGKGVMVEKTEDGYGIVFNGIEKKLVKTAPLWAQ